MHQQLSVAMLMREFYPLSGGYQNQALRLATEMVGRDIQVHVVTQRQGSLSAYEKHDQIHIHRVRALFSGHLCAFFFLGSAFLWMLGNRDKFQLIHANRSSSGLIAGVIGFMLGKKVLYKLTRGDEIDIKGFRSTWWGRLKLFFLKRTVDKFIAITEQIREDLKGLGIAEHKIVRIPNGIVSDTSPNRYDTNQVKKELGLGSDAMVVTFVGRLVRAKGVDWLLEVWSNLTHQERNARLLIVGEGVEKASLETQAQLLGIRDTVRFTGQVEDVWKILATTDVFVLPSRKEGISNALLEAMSQGLPVIVADDSLGGNRAVVDNNLNGYLVPFGDSDRLSQLLVKLLRSVELRIDLGRNARQKIQRHYSVTSVANQYCTVYRQLLNDAGHATTTPQSPPISRRPSVGIFLARPDRSVYMARKLRERGFDVVNYNTQEYEDHDWIKIRKGFLPALSHILFRTHHDVYFAALSFVPSLSTYFNKILRGKPYVFNTTGVKWEMFKDRSRGKPFAGFFQNRFYPFLLKLVYSGASRIVCNSRFLESTLARRYPQYRPRLLTIYNGIPFERYNSGRRQSIPGVGEHDCTLLCVTSLDYENKSRGLRLVIDAYGHVRASRPDVKLVIAANASSRYRQLTEDYLRSKAWHDCVTIYYNHPNIPDLLASAEIFVYATPHNSNDSLPRALLEAQSAGLPAVVTDTTGCPEIVCHGKTGFVVPYDASAMAERISELVENPQLRCALGAEARQWISETFNWDRMADQYADVFQQIVAETDERYRVFERPAS